MPYFLQNDFFDSLILIYYNRICLVCKEFFANLAPQSKPAPDRFPSEAGCKRPSFRKAEKGKVRAFGSEKKRKDILRRRAENIAFHRNLRQGIPQRLRLAARPAKRAA